jgi:hypothetical protein
MSRRKSEIRRGKIPALQIAFGISLGAFIPASAANACGGIFDVACNLVESRCGAVSVGRTYPFPPLSSGGALVVRPWLRFHIPLIEPDVQISRIRLSDKTSRLHPRHVVPKRGQAYECESG